MNLHDLLMFLLSLPLCEAGVDSYSDDRSVVLLIVSFAYKWRSTCSTVLWGQSQAELTCLRCYKTSLVVMSHHSGMALEMVMWTVSGCIKLIQAGISTIEWFAVIVLY